MRISLLSHFRLAIASRFDEDDIVMSRCGEGDLKASFVSKSNTENSTVLTARFPFLVTTANFVWSGEKRPTGPSDLPPRKYPRSAHRVIRIASSTVTPRG